MCSLVDARWTVAADAPRVHVVELRICRQGEHRGVRLQFAPIATPCGRAVGSSWLCRKKNYGRRSGIRGDGRAGTRAHGSTPMAAAQRGAKMWGHNALDKVIVTAIFAEQLPLQDSLLLMSVGRVSVFEINAEKRWGRHAVVAGHLGADRRQWEFRGGGQTLVVFGGASG